MKIISSIAATAALIVSAWAVTVPPVYNSDSESPQNAQNPIQSLAAAVNTGDTNRVRTIESDASHKIAPRNAIAMYWRCRKYIEQNYQRLQTAQQIALECHLDATSLRTAFQHYGHQTPEQFLSHIKLVHAAAYAAH